MLQVNRITSTPKLQARDVAGERVFTFNLVFMIRNDSGRDMMLPCLGFFIVHQSQPDKGGMTFSTYLLTGSPKPRILRKGEVFQSIPVTVHKREFSPDYKLRFHSARDAMGSGTSRWDVIADVVSLPGAPKPPALPAR